MVKRITGLPKERIGDRTLADDELWVEGDREDASTDSRHFGPVRREQVKAKVVLVYWPKERRRRIG
jgi:type IV secretory pathway protease TraF